MKNQYRNILPVCILFVFWAMMGLAQAQWLNNNEVAFIGTITSVSVNGEGVGTLFVRMNTVDLRVIVNSKTILQDTEGESITMDRLAEIFETKPEESEVLLEILGKFSSSGILATKVDVLESADLNTFSVRGTIQQMVPSGDNLLLSLLGMRVLVTSETAILINGAPGSPSDLSVWKKVEAEGHIEEVDEESGVWVAETIKILTENKRRGSLVFEGEVTEFDSEAGLLLVAVSGMEGNITPVYITQATRIVGELAVGVIVHVSGILEADMTIKAKEIIVVSALELKPDDVKLAVGETIQLTVKLREVATTDINITLSSDNEAVASLSSPFLIISEGGQSATFDVNAVDVGTAIITATDGMNTATAEVKVGELSEDETDPPDAEVRVAFAPDHVKLGLYENREVVLLIKPPQKTAVEVTFTVTSDTSDLFIVSGQRMFNNGAAYLKVMLTAGSINGSGTLIATLPEALGGGTAELIVEVGRNNGKK